MSEGVGKSTFGGKVYVGGKEVGSIPPSAQEIAIKQSQEVLSCLVALLITERKSEKGDKIRVSRRALKKFGEYRVNFEIDGDDLRIEVSPPANRRKAKP